MSDLSIAQQPNSAIAIEQKGDVLVVDSRLIAGELGIEHRALMQTIKKYLDRLERKDPVTFQMSLVKRPQGGTYEETYCYLNEQQANLLMTFSRNTEKVLNCKERLVEAFMQAKQIIPRQAEAIKELELRLALAQAETQRAIAEKAVLDTRHLIVSTCPEPTQQKIFGYKVIKDIEYRDRVFVADDLINDGSTVNKTTLCQRYGILTRNSKPDYKRLNQYLDKLPADAFSPVPVIQENRELQRSFLPMLDLVVEKSDRQLWLGEDA